VMEQVDPVMGRSPLRKLSLLLPSGGRGAYLKALNGPMCEMWGRNKVGTQKRPLVLLQRRWLGSLGRLF
jgi:hypothetical protein